MGLWDDFKRLISKQAKLEAQREIDEPVINEKIEGFKKADLIDALRETGETDEVDNQVIIQEQRNPQETGDIFLNEQMRTKRKGIIDRLKDTFNKTMQEVLVKDIDREIRKESRSDNYFYFNLSNNKEQDAIIFAREEKAIENAFEKNSKHLEKYFSQEEIYQLKLKFMERAKLWDEFRQEGLDFRAGKINRLKTLESEFGVESAESKRFLDLSEIEFKAKQRVRGLDKKIANERKLVFIDGIWEKKNSRGARTSEKAKAEGQEFSRWDSDQYRNGMNDLVEAGEQVKVEKSKPLQEYLHEAAKARRDYRTQKKVEKAKERQRQ
ncbi:MAG: hypothetical protein PHS83_04940 [Clostridia bacterium]|nr:hypothetical protein [Clostridia bacterium]MDD4665902.1 hypothetical protein [Clostridia bacterium]